MTFRAPSCISSVRFFTLRHYVNFASATLYINGSICYSQILRNFCNPPLEFVDIDTSDILRNKLTPPLPWRSYSDIGGERTCFGLLPVCRCSTYLVARGSVPCRHSKLQLILN